MNEYSAPVIAKNLKKIYGNFDAVKGVSFCVDTGDCFGLLGIVLRIITMFIAMHRSISNAFFVFE